jgi:uncharacterized protein (TIGR03086 family)
MDRTIADWHAEALDATRTFVHGITPDQWARPTPCAGWDVRTLLNHLVTGNWWAVELGSGRTIDDVGDRLDGDILGDDPAAAYDESVPPAKAIFLAPGALDAPCAVSYGPVPGSVYAGHRFIDVVVHGWDLAAATGQDATLDPRLVDVCFEVIEPQAEMLLGSGAFGTRAEPAPGDDAQARLLRLLGRQPTVNS